MKQTFGKVYDVHLQIETRAAWVFLCRGTLESRTGWPMLTWRSYLND
jgi:hypothetical protein